MLLTRIGQIIKWRLLGLNQFVHEESHVWAPRISFGVHWLRLTFLKLWLTMSGGRLLIGVALIEHMGDIAASEPLSRRIRSAYPDAYIVWCVRAPYRELIDNNPVVDATLIVPCLTEWIYLRNTAVFDKVIDLHIQGRPCLRCNIPLNKPEGNQRITLSNYYNFGSLLEVQAQNAGLIVEDEKPRLSIPQAAVRRIDRLKLPESYLVIHCSSNEASRDWPRQRWCDLVHQLVTIDNLHLVEIGLVPVVAASATSNYTNLCGAVSLIEMAEIIRRALMFVGIDSGPAHLANAVSTFGVILLGPYRAFRRYMPYSGPFKDGKNAKIIYEDSGLQNLCVGKVYREMSSALINLRPQLNDRQMQ
jgi:heptosyltransferase-3